MIKKSNQEESRQHNRRLVLSTIYQHGEISRVEIAHHTHLTRTTVSEIVAELMRDGLVKEIGLAPSTGGKPATLLGVAENAHWLIGVDLGEKEFCGALVNLRGEIGQYRCLARNGDNAEAALEQVYRLIEELIALADRPVIGIGIGVPGLMEPESGRVRQAVHLDWHDLPLGDLLYQRFHLPVHLSNDCQVAALGEYTFGGPGANRNLILIKAGRGLGAGIVLNGQLFYGDNAGAGEIGHIRVVADGDLCRCGNQGCLETITSSRALLRKADLLAPGEFPDLEHLAQAYRTGDPRVQTWLEEAGTALGQIVIHLVSALNLNRILIAGNLSCCGEGLLPPIQHELQHGVLPALAQQTEVGLASLGSNIVILGAASLVLKNELGLF
jgi:predicted NBD/HSP70 family sugar kinase